MRKLLIILFVLIISLPAEAQQLYKPFTSFNVIKTEYFDIVFPKESESSARILASYADNVYEQMSSLFGIEVPGRIPVTFTPHTDLFNGYYNPVPYPHIVLFDTPSDLEWTNFANNLEALFIHELAHAVSLNTRSPFFRVLRGIFGNWATPAAINAPAFMVEGVTISMESMTGFGRANDPLNKQKLRQAIHEDKFLTPFQASNVFDHPNQSGVYYSYGGLFSFWLIQNYGMEKYTELWQDMGKLTWFSFVVYRSGFYRIFKNVYDINFIDAWNAFSDSLELKDLEENTDVLFPGQPHFFTERKNTISAMAAREKSVYILDNTQRKIHIYDTQTGAIRSIKSDAVNLYDLDVSADGTTALVSGYHVTGDRYRAVVIEHKTDSGRKTGRTIRGLYKARYFRDGLIGIRSDLHKNLIVYEDFNGKQEILFRGAEELSFSGPQAVDDERFVFVVARNGVRELMLYNYVSGELFRIESSGTETQYWHYMRGLNVSEGKLFFSHNADDRMYKLASIDLDTMQASFNNRDFSGGVFYPVSADGTVYYSGAFFTGDDFLRFPETTDPQSETVVGINLVKTNKEDYGFSSVLHVAENTPAAETSLTPDPLLPASKPYFGISYMNPFQLWLPLPLLRLSTSDDNFNLSLDGGGLFSLMIDPTDRNIIIIFAYADIVYRMAMIENFTWQSTVAGFPMTLEFSDKVLIDSYDNPYRDTRVTLNGSINHYPGRWGYGLNIGGGYLRIADDRSEIKSYNAYEWEERGSAFFMGCGFSVTNLQRRRNELFGNGVSLSVKGISLIETFYPRIEGVFRASLEERFPLNLTLYGAYDDMGMNLRGVSRSYGQPIFDNAASKEYPPFGGQSYNWLAGGELSLGIFSIEIQNNLSHAYFNRFFGTLALRNVFYDSRGMEEAPGIELHDGIRLAQSLVLNLKLVSAFIPIKAVPVFLEPHVWGAWRFSNTITGEGFHWAYGFGMSYQYNGRLRAAEVLVNGKESTLIRERETFEDMTRHTIVPEYLKK